MSSNGLSGFGKMNRNFDKPLFAKPLLFVPNPDSCSLEFKLSANALLGKITSPLTTLSICALVPSPGPFSTPDSELVDGESTLVFATDARSVLCWLGGVVVVVVALGLNLVHSLLFRCELHSARLGKVLAQNGHLARS